MEKEKQKVRFENANPVSLAAYETQARRVAILAAVYEKGAPSYLDAADLWVGRTLMRAEMTSLVNLLAQKGLITHEEFLDGARDMLEVFMAGKEKEHNMIILSNEVLQDGKSLMKISEAPDGRTQG